MHSFMEQVMKRSDTVMTNNSPLQVLKEKVKRSVLHTLKQLKDWETSWKQLRKASEKGSIRSIDGRQIAVDSPHKALNYLLQSGAGVVAKRWMVINQQTIKETNIQANQLAFIHDELQFECSREFVSELSTSSVYSATAAGEYYNIRCRIDAEAKHGNNWSEVH
eukprot:TRINITY_DN7698_c0_g1_i1.p1 TRINITY_DN7698_c0_g1~~TRINITY_DN7698_c0_g1_i1.p1  ORF type:complete len:164 (-),score=14.54 TRINITY_DN7698_c0_g1_i1:324-815(-)